MNLLEQFKDWDDVVEFDKKTTIFRELDPADNMYVILSGEVEITLRGEPLGAELEGGIIAHSMTDLEIECLPGDLPEYIEVDMEQLSVGDNLHISDLSLPQGVESVALQHGEDHDLPVAAVNKKKGEEVDEEAAAEGTGEAAQPSAEAGEAEGGDSED